MRIAISLLFAFAVSLAQSAQAAQPSVPIINYENLGVATATGKTLSIEQVKEAIGLGTGAQKWLVAHPSPGMIIATLNIGNGKHVMMVEIPYNAQNYSIKYKDSVNLGYGMLLEEGVPGIHPNYNRWVNSLKDSIRLQFMRY